MTLFESLEEARRATAASTACLFAQHQRVLGTAVSSLVGQLPFDRLSFARARADLWNLLAAGVGRVVITSSGLLGDSGAGYPSFYAWSKSEVRRQLLQAQPSTYAALLESRQLLRVAQTTSITPGPYLMSTHIGIDGRQFLPPFFPVFRGQDLAFGSLLKLCNDDHLFAHLPHAVLHVPFQPRRASLERLWPEGDAPAFAVLLDACLGQVSPGAAQTAAGSSRLRLVGRLLRELGALPLAELGFALHSRLAATGGPTLSRQLAELRSHGDRSLPWVRDLHSLVEHRLLQLMRPGALAARDVSAASPADPAGETAKLIRQFGSLLECWPDLLAEAPRLTGNDGLFTPLH